MIKVRQIKILVTKDSPEVLKTKIAQKLKINPNQIINYYVHKKAIDARDKKAICYVYEVIVCLKDEDSLLKKINNIDVLKYTEKKFILPESKKRKEIIWVIGSGPAGLFASYFLTKAGFQVNIVERGAKMEERINDVLSFWQNDKLNCESNVCFGEGGAGTFSDGKLNTLIKDKDNLIDVVMDKFIECGANEEIKYIHNPHIGTDNLRIIVKNMREKIIAMGGKFYFKTKLTDLIIEDNKIKGVVLNDNLKMAADAVVLAIGHSARDTFYMLNKNKVVLHNKPFAVGIRIMHPQQLIDDNQYGSFKKYLPPASYKLTYKTKDHKGVYSFCMCPGGYVVNSSSSINKLCINGMSNYKRDSQVANSAIVVTVDESIYGNKLFDGVKYQEKLESLAYNLGNGKIPVQKWIDFQNNKVSNIPANLKIKGKYISCNIKEVLPQNLSDALLEAMPHFGQKIKGFDSAEALIAIIESRSSSPIRINRDENMESNIKGLYPIGEGAGYAGGITTSSIDGIKVALKLINKYND